MSAPDRNAADTDGMSIPSFRSAALGDIANDEAAIARLLAEDETLFAEHKSDISQGVGYQLAKATASFANTLGGWILVGVENGSPVPNWEPPGGGFVDAVRQRLEGQLDPVPSIAARTVTYQEAEIGVVRVYESADTPHILIADGSIVVREPAQDAKLRKAGKYYATPIRSHYELSQLTRRGEDAAMRARRRFDAGETPFVDDALAIKWTQAAGPTGVFLTQHAEQPAIVLRVAPLTMSGRWEEWATSLSTVEALASMSCRLAGTSAAAGEPRPHARGAAVTARGGSSEAWTPEGSQTVSPHATAAVDAAGVFGLRLGFGLAVRDGLTEYKRDLQEGQGLEELIEPLLQSVVGLLAEAEHLGRYEAHISWLRMGDLYERKPTSQQLGPPAYVPCGGQLNVDGKSVETGSATIARRWSQELARASGVPVWT